MDLNFPLIEKNVLKFWKDKSIFKRLIEKNQRGKHWSFLDGPITANNPMGVHHAWGRTYKDVFQRYKAMQGFKQRFQNGFDCQGLWVEVEVEKELGFKSKKDIEEYGVAKFVEKCKERVMKYSEIQTKQSIRLGQWMDWDNSYYTMSDENNYAIWSFLKKCWDDKLLYKGRDVVPWCPRCGTAISQHEILTEEYKEITHKAVYIKFPVVGEKNTFFLAWTTTPWTLPANVALAVNPDLLYVKVRDGFKRRFYLLKDRQKRDDLIDGEIEEEFLGKDLKGKEYQGIFDNLSSVKESLGNYKHKIVLWDEVTGEEGTGIVHIAPGCGQEDFQLAKKENLPVIDPLDDESKYKIGFGDFSKHFAGSEEIRNMIFNYLKGKKVDSFKKEESGAIYQEPYNYLHRYPTCWRCKTELVFRLVDEWYISMGKIREKLKEVARAIKWIPSFGLDRELDWLDNMGDWLISKKRYWGLALPIYECSCGNFEVIGSKEELKERAIEGWQEFEGHSPHRPWIDKVKIKCSKCKKKTSRIIDVGNPWLDAGIVPFSTMGYFSDRDYWNKWFPADFICESFPGQFKNWFYSLIVMSAVLEGVSPVKTIFGYASVRDEKGEEMHKSKGNAIWFDDAVEKVGADPMRWLYARQNPSYNLNFGYKAIEEVRGKLMTLYNVFTFFSTYVDKKDIPSEVNIKSKNILDKWIISRLNRCLVGTIYSLTPSSYEIFRTVLLIEDFFINDLSLWYLRRSRKRFHNNSVDKKEAIGTFYYVLLNLLKIIAPIIPFFSEEMYLQLRTEGMPESIHLNSLPYDINDLSGAEDKIDQNLEEKMAKAREVVALALAKRAKSGIKVRQPLKELIITDSDLKKEKELLDLIKEEVNVKKIGFGKEIKLDAEISSELKEEGMVREIIRNIQELRKKTGLKPEHIISIGYSADFDLARILEKNKKTILKQTKAKDLIEKEKQEQIFDAEKITKVDAKEIKLFIKKIN